jgi:hypothetical protein
MDEESTGRMDIPPVIISTGTNYPPVEWDSAGNYVPDYKRGIHPRNGIL